MIMRFFKRPALIPGFIAALAVAFAVSATAQASTTQMLYPPPSAQQWPGASYTDVSCYGVSNTCNTTCSNGWTLTDNLSSYIASAWLGSDRHWDDAMSVNVAVNSASVWQENSVFDATGHRTIDQETANTNQQYQFGKDCGCSGGCGGGDAGVTHTFFTHSAGAMNTMSMSVSGQQKRGGDMNPFGAARAFGASRVICDPGQKNDNGTCVDIVGTITLDKDTCPGSCDVTATWSSNSVPPASVTITGTDGFSATWNNVSLPNGSQTIHLDGSNTAYVFCLNGTDGFGSPVLNLDCYTLYMGPVNPPAVGIQAHGNPVDYNTPTVLSWSSSNADSCAITSDLNGDGWSNPNQAYPPGQTTSNLTAATTYTIRCSNGGGSAQASVTVNVNPRPLSCSAAPNPVAVNQQTILSAQGGSGSFYSWTTQPGSGASWASNAGNGLGVSFSTPGNKTVTAASGSQTATCIVTVNAGSCSYSIYPTGKSFSAAGGTGVIDVTAGSVCSWMAVPNDSWITITAGSTGAGNGSAGYAVAPNSGGPRAGTIAIAGQTFTVTQAGSSALACQPSSVNTRTDSNVAMTARGGSGTYYWTAPNGSPATGSGSSFITRYASEGSYTITLSDGASTVGCPVNIGSGSAPTCSISASPASGAPPVAGTLSWSASGASSCTASGGWSGSKSPTAGTAAYGPINAPTAYNLSCTGSSGLTGSCTTTVSVGGGDVYCTPSVTTAPAGSLVTFGAAGGTGTYAWNAPGAMPGTGAGIYFSATYPNPGSYQVAVQSGGRSAQCAVTITNASKPDLVIRDFHLTDAGGARRTVFSRGEKLYPSVTIFNNGTVPAASPSGRFLISVYSNRPALAPAGTASDVGVTVTESGILQPGQQKIYSVADNSASWSNQFWTTNLPPGSYTARAYVNSDNSVDELDTSNNQATSGYVVGGPAPTIALNPPQMAFWGALGGPAPESRDLTIANVGTAPLNWTATPNKSWCHISTGSGTLAAGGSAVVQVSVDGPDSSGLVIGLNQCAIVVSDPLATNNPQTETVYYSVSQAPTNDCSIAGASFRYMKFENITPQQWAAWNELEFFDIDGNQLHPAIIGGTPDWIYPSQGAYGKAAAIDGNYFSQWNSAAPGYVGNYQYPSYIIFDFGSQVVLGRARFLTERFGPRNVNIWVSADDPASQTALLKNFTGSFNDKEWIDFYCPSAQADPPHIVLDPDRFEFTGVSGEAASSPASAAMSISTNRPNSTLVWIASTDKPWCHISPTSGTAPFGSNSAATITVDSPSVAGSYDCIVTVSDGGSRPPADNSPRQATVHYTVKPGNPGGGSGGVTATLGSCPSRNITVSWTAAPSGGMPVTYNIYRNGSLYRSGITEISFTDASTAIGQTYTYGVQAVSGGQTAPNITYASPVIVESCTPGQPTGFSGDNTGQCQEVALSWSAPASGITPTDYWIYRISQDDYNAGARPNPYSSAYIGQYRIAVVAHPGVSYEDHSVPAGIYYYWIVSANGTIASSPITPISNGGTISTASCGANLDRSDKDITGVGGTTFPGMEPNSNVCNGFQPVPPSAQFEIGDTVAFRIQICNNDPVNSNGDAENVVVADRLTNLSEPSGGWQAQYADAGGTIRDFVRAADCTSPSSPGRYSVCGSSPNQTLTFNVGTVAEGRSIPITYYAKAAVAGTFQGTFNRFQNSADIAFGLDGRAQAATPFIPFTIPGDYPSRGEH